MTNPWTKLLLPIAVCALTVSARALTILPVWDTTISGNATDGPKMEAAINAAIQVFETNFADNFTVSITFTVDPNAGLATSDSTFVFVNYSAYRAALVSKATSVYDILALSQLPNTSANPVNSGTQMLITAPLASLLGLSTNSPNGSTISFNTNVMSFKRPTPNSTSIYDMQSAMEHEIDEVLGGGGAGCDLGSFTNIGSTDLFRYATNSANSKLARSWKTSLNAYFSVDGTNLWSQFNTNLDGSDLGDFWGVNYVNYLPVYWAPPSGTPHCEVQDAYGTSGFFEYPTNFTIANGYNTNYFYENTSPDLGTNELIMLDVIGWTLIPPAPKLNIVNSGPGRVTISWSSPYLGFHLQQSTNLQANSWVASASGTNNPAVIAASSTPTYYRLGVSATPSVATPLVAMPAPTNAPVSRVTGIRPRPY